MEAITLAGKLEVGYGGTVEWAENWPMVGLYAARRANGFEFGPVVSGTFGDAPIYYRPTATESADLFAALPENETFKRAVEVSMAGGHLLFAWTRPGLDLSAILAQLPAGSSVAFPCPCGHLGDRGHECRCTLRQVERNRAKLRATREAAEVHCEAVTPRGNGRRPGEPFSAVAERVREAASRPTPNRENDAARMLFNHAAERLGFDFSRQRAAFAVAATVARLCGADLIAPAHAAEAIQLAPRF